MSVKCVRCGETTDTRRTDIQEWVVFVVTGFNSTHQWPYLRPTKVKDRTSEQFIAECSSERPHYAMGICPMCQVNDDRNER